MARREWAEQWAFDASEGDTAQIRMTVAAKRLQAEHARAVRIVKKKIRSLEACIASDKRDGNEAGATLHVYALSILNSTLVEMQKGRA
jgi:hypothetical protein